MSALSLLSSLPLPVQQAWSMPGVGEWLVILVIVLVIFGPAKLPGIGEAIGKSIRGFKKAVSAEDEIDVTPRQLDEPKTPLNTDASRAADEQKTHR